jgi:adenylate cyclase
VHLGDVVEEADGDLMGEGVNIAARLEGVAKPGAICLSEDAYRQVKGRLDLSVIDLGPTQLKNIADPIRVYSLEVGAPSPAKPTPAPARKIHRAAPLHGRLAVRQYRRRPAHEHFVDGVTESLTTDLSRIRGAVVIARNTAFTFKGRPLDVKMIGRELNVRYALEGSGAETAYVSMCSSSTPKRVAISGQSGSTSRRPISSTCRTKSSRAWLARWMPADRC